MRGRDRPPAGCDRLANRAAQASGSRRRPAMAWSSSNTTHDERHGGLVKDSFAVMAAVHNQQRPESTRGRAAERKSRSRTDMGLQQLRCGLTLLRRQERRGTPGCGPTQPERDAPEGNPEDEYTSNGDQTQGWPAAAARQRVAGLQGHGLLAGHVLPVSAGGRRGRGGDPYREDPPEAESTESDGGRRSKRRSSSVGSGFVTACKPSDTAWRRWSGRWPRRAWY